MPYKKSGFANFIFSTTALVRMASRRLAASGVQRKYSVIAERNVSDFFILFQLLHIPDSENLSAIKVLSVQPNYLHHLGTPGTGVNAGSESIDLSHRLEPVA